MCQVESNESDCVHLTNYWSREGELQRRLADFLLCERSERSVGWTDMREFRPNHQTTWR